MPRVIVPTQLRGYTAGKDEVRADGATLDEILVDLDRQFPGVRFRVIDEQNRVRRHILLFVGMERQDRALSGERLPANRLGRRRRHLDLRRRVAMERQGEVRRAEQHDDCRRPRAHSLHAIAPRCRLVHVQSLSAAAIR